ncbi:MAG: hypothetical protein IJ468_06400 [Lachnospiraceae bacterium]|nr:hypothetical protein [Lachnospiraceae bacterium]
MNILTATGASITKEDLFREKFYDIRAFGACEEQTGEPSHCIINTNAVNAAIEQAAADGGGTVVIPDGEFKVYTIRLKSNVNLYLSDGAVLRAARTDITGSYEKQKGEGGNYDEPEVNRYAGLQDHGHTYFANSMFYAADQENIMIYGKGLIDGSCYDEETGYRQYVLMGGDPWDHPMRNERGHRGEWFGNKAIALVRCQNIVLADFSLVIGGHFAIIAEGVTNMLIADVLVDTTRDALDVDCCQDVTVRNSVFNSLTDDALVMKSSYGAGIFMPTKNVLIEDCVVSGYDAGSVYAKTYTRDKLIATDRCGPTGRVKFGTEATCGYDQVTIRRTKFDRSRGFAMEAVDGSDLTNVIFTDCTMDMISSSPIFIRAGERGRYPVTGMQTSEEVTAKEPNVRLDNRNWVLPDTDDYQKYPALRYAPSYKKDRKVTVDGHSWFTVVDGENPVRLNEANVTEKDGVYYGKSYVEGQGYVTDWSAPLTKEEALCRGNGNGCAKMARVSNVEISNVTITNADPRYPILLMGLADSKIENVVLKNIRAQFRGGLTMEHAVEQRQLNTNWEYAQFETAPSVQTLPWLVNTFFLKEEGLLPRVDWDPERGTWKDDPYNVPEMPAVYPEPSNWGILPAYGFYARHVDGLTIEGMTLEYLVEDTRHAIVFDDAANVTLKDICAKSADGVEPVALVTNCCRRHTNEEYVPELPYFTTTVSGLTLPLGLEAKLVTVEAPAPGTPTDSHYPYPTLPIPENGYQFAVPTESYPLPRTVFRPFFALDPVYEGVEGEEQKIRVVLRNPASETSRKQTSGMIYNEAAGARDFTVTAEAQELNIQVCGLPEGAVWEEETMTITWTPKAGQNGSWQVTMTADDGLIPEQASFIWRINERGSND